MKKTRQTLKVGDIFKHEDNNMLSRCVKWDSSTPAQTWRLENECKVWNILPTGIVFERVSYTGDRPFETTFEELERVGILDKVTEEEFNVGDEVECINLTNLGETPYPYFAEDNIKIGDRLIVKETGYRLYFEGKTYCFDKTSFKKVNRMTNTYKKGDKFKIEKGISISYATKDNSKDWSNGYLSSLKYEIKQITKTQVYFNKEGELDSNWYIMKTKVFESIAVFDKPAEAPKTKTIIGYKVLKAFPSTEGLYKVGEIVTLSNKIFSSGSNFPDFLEPVYEEDFKVGDYVTIKSVETYNYGNSSGNEQPVVGQSYKIRKFYDDYLTLDAVIGYIAIKKQDLRKATAEEIEEATTKKISNIGSKNATLTLNKNGNTIRITGKIERLYLDALISAYNNICRQSIGGFNIEPYSRTERLFRVGCEQEDNRVSLAEIKAVIDKFKK